MTDRLTGLRVVCLVICGMGVAPLILAAQQTAPATPALEPQTFAGIDEQVEEAIAEGRVAGCSVMVIRDDQVQYYRHWGQRDAARELPVERDTIWRIYSMTKPITSVAVMQLVEQGLLDLDEPVSRYIPQLAEPVVLVENDGEFEEVPARREITVRDLLRHSSGLTYGFFGNSEVDRRYLRAGVLAQEDLESMVEKLADLPLKHQPGSRFEYSVSTDLLGYLVQVVSGQPFDQYLQEHILQPLQMKDTSFVVPEPKQERLAELYRPSRRGGLSPAPARSSVRFVDPQTRFFSGGGGLCSTIDDYGRFCRMLLGGGELDGKRIVSEDSLKEMWTNQLGDLDRSSLGFRFGLGFRISRQGDYSWGGAAGTRFWVHPEKDLAILFMVQVNPWRESLADQVREMVYQALEP